MWECTTVVAMSCVPVGELRRSSDNGKFQVSIILTQHNLVVAFPLHREEVHAFVVGPGRSDLAGGFDAKGRHHGVAHRDQCLDPCGRIANCPDRQHAHAVLFFDELKLML